MSLLIGISTVMAQRTVKMTMQEQKSMKEKVEEEQVLFGQVRYIRSNLHALRRTGALDSRQQHRLEQLIERWIMDPSSFIGPDGDVSTLYMRHPQGY